MASIDDGWGVVTTANSCGNHPIELDFAKDDVKMCLYVESGCSCGTNSKGTTCDSYCDTWSTSILVLKDGRFVMAHESSDTSGHG